METGTTRQTQNISVTIVQCRRRWADVVQIVSNCFVCAGEDIAEGDRTGEAAFFTILLIRAKKNWPLRFFINRYRYDTWPNHT